jgi:HEAT repeat protein
MLRARLHEIPLLVRQLGSRSKARVDAAQARLSIIGARAIEDLVEALEGDNNRVRARVMPLLALIQDPRGREPLIAMLLDRNDRLREIAARSLARFPSQESVAALDRVLTRDKRSRVRVAAIESLIEQYAAGQEAALRVPLGLLMDSTQESQIRSVSIPVLRHLRPSHRRSVLTRLEVDPCHELRALASSWEDSGAASLESLELEALLESLASDEYQVWNAAVERLGHADTTGVRRIILEMRRRSHDPEYCARAGMALKALGPRRGRPVADALSEVEEALPLQVLIEVIGAIGHKALIYRLADLIRRLSEAMGDRDDGDGFEPLQRVRAKAHLELARIGSRVAIGDLRDALLDPKRRLELEMPAAVRLIGKREEIPPLLRIYTREEPFMRAQIADAVRAIMRREQIRRNNRIFQSVDRDQKVALAAILPPLRPRRERRSRVARPRAR